MGRDKLAYFNQHVGGIAILSEPALKMLNMYEADKSDEQPASPRNLDME